MSPGEISTDPQAIEGLRGAIGRYLDGAAGPGERAAVEQALLEDAGAQLLAEELLLRHLLAHAPPEVPPEAVVARWEAAVLGQVAEEAVEEATADVDGWFDTALDVFGWSVRGPALAVNTAGARAATHGLTAALNGVPREPSKPLWRRLASRGLSRLSPKKWSHR